MFSGLEDKVHDPVVPRVLPNQCVVGPTRSTCEWNPAQKTESGDISLKVPPLLETYIE